MTATATAGPTSDAPTGVTRERLYRMMRVYKETALLRTGVQLGVFDALADGPRDAAAVAERVGADPRGTRLLLNALAALHLVRSEGGRYALDAGARELLVRTSARYYGGMVDVVASDVEWDALRDLTAAVRRGGSVSEVDAETPGYGYWETFARSVGPVTVPTAGLLADVLAPWAADRGPLSVLDLACGHGIYGFTMAERFPGSTVTCVDWPNVLEITAEHARRRGLADRTTLVPGDMFDVAVPGPHDLVLVTNVVHHFSEERSTQLLARAAADLAPGGRVGIVGFVAGDGEPAVDPEPHLFSILMLVWTQAGEVHTHDAYTRMTAGAGLEIESALQVPGLPFHVVVARRPR
jgi:C-methyltransferase